MGRAGVLARLPTPPEPHPPPSTSSPSTALRGRRFDSSHQVLPSKGPLDEVSWTLSILILLLPRMPKLLLLLLLMLLLLLLSLVLVCESETTLSLTCARSPCQPGVPEFPSSLTLPLVLTVEEEMQLTDFGLSRGAAG